MTMGTGPGPQQPQQGNRPGQMTAVMRAMAVATGPKVLRIALVQQKRVIEERIIKARTTVTVGQNEKCVFVIPAPGLPPQFKLFELVGTEYYLNFLDNMKGRVALPTGFTDLADLRGQARKVGGAYQVKLTDETRGKVEIGETTFLFQFVAPPPVQPRPQLPLAVKGGLANQIDWTLTIIAAFSFLTHFGLVGSLYSDWMDPLVNDDTEVGSLVDLMKNIPVPPEPEKPVEASTAAAATASAPAAKTPQTAPPSGASATKGAPVSETKAAALSAQAEQMQMAMLASLGGTTAVQGALNRSDIPPVDLNTAAANGAGVTAGTGDLRFGPNGGPVTNGPNGKGLSGIGPSTVATAATGPGTEKKTEGPKGDAQPGAVGASVQVTGADRVIAGMRGRFRKCYNDGLAQDPTMSGRVVISAKVGPNGEVISADVASNSGLSGPVAACIARTVRSGQFEPPAGGATSTLSIPVSFVQQK